MQVEFLTVLESFGLNVDVQKTLFSSPYNEALIHQIVVAFRANARLGTRAQLDRANVKHSTKKPWRQKGTGRARAGSTSSPLWRGGGRVFPNSPLENFSQKVNKKMYRIGMVSIISQLFREERLIGISYSSMSSCKTRLLATRLKEMGFISVLIIVDRLDSNLFLASRNLPNVAVIEAYQVNPLILLSYDQILLTESAVNSFGGMFL
jgi:large subunit ribosomal protein L4